jgi:tRNA pseudouridine13 synthase
MIDEDKTEGGEGSAENEKVIKVVTADDIASKKYSMTDVVLPLVGTKVQYPENESGELFDTLLIEYGITKQLFHKVQDRDFSLKGDYRKLVCKPTDVDFEIQEYTNPLQPLIKTDFMELEEESSNQNPDKQVDANEREGGAVLLGMVVGFTLPSSSYATIALRELMKRPTSSEYQSQLKLEGRCEANVASATQESENGNKGI